MNIPETVSYRMGNAFFYLTKEGAELFKQPELLHIDDLFERGIQLKKTATTTAVLAAVPDSDKKVFLKRNSNKGFAFTLRYLFRRARVFRAARAAALLETAGVRTPKVLFAGERRNGLILKCGYLATETADDIHSVASLLKKAEDPSLFIRSFLPKAAVMTALLHRNGLIHGDLKIINMYHTGPWSPDSTYGIWDLDSVRQYRGTPPVCAIEKDLSRIVFSTCMGLQENPASATENPVHAVTDLLVSEYMKHISENAVRPSPEKVETLAEERLEYRRIHPYRKPAEGTVEL